MAWGGSWIAGHSGNGVKQLHKGTLNCEHSAIVHAGSASLQIRDGNTVYCKKKKKDYNIRSFFKGTH